MFEQRFETIKTNEQITPEEFQDAIKELIKEYLEKQSSDEKILYVSDINFSDPKSDDINAIRSGKYKIEKFRTTPAPDNEKDRAGELNFHFYVGKTEIHIFGKAAKRVYELINIKSENEKFN